MARGTCDHEAAREEKFRMRSNTTKQTARRDLPTPTGESPGIVRTR